MLNSCVKSSHEMLPETPMVAFEEAPDDFRLTDGFSNVQFLQLEMTEESAIDIVRKILDADNYLVVETRRNELLSFDRKNGKFINKIGAVGEGPGEYIRVSDVVYNEKSKSIDVYDDFKKKCLSYSPNGNFLFERKIDAPINYANNVVKSGDGYTMFALQFPGDKKSENFSYTVITPEGTNFQIDPLAPVQSGDYVTAFAQQPISTSGDKISFLKFLNDTIFALDKGKILPQYKLSLKQKIPSREIIAQYGDFDLFALQDFCTTNGYFTGFNKIYETEKYILLIPYDRFREGYFWIDKTTNKGFRVPSSNKLNLETDLMIQGRSIIGVVGSNDKELMCSFQANPIVNMCILRSLKENPDLQPFDSRLREFFENADPDGNPCIIIYEH